jgi:hypothetical protein
MTPGIWYRDHDSVYPYPEYIHDKLYVEDMKINIVKDMQM